MLGNSMPTFVEQLKHDVCTYGKKESGNPDLAHVGAVGGELGLDELFSLVDILWKETSRV